MTICSDVEKYPWTSYADSVRCDASWDERLYLGGAYASGATLVLVGRRKKSRAGEQVGEKRKRQ